MNEHARLALTSKATSKGQTTIPKPVRDALGIKDGTQLRWVLEDGVLKVTAKSVNIVDFAGFLGPVSNGRKASIADLNQAVGEAVAARFQHKTPS